MTRTLTVIAHIATPSITVLDRVARANGWAIDLVHPHRGEPLPEQPEAVVVLGGPQSAYDAQAHPYLTTEIEYIARCHRAGIPMLAICLGSQLLAEALGGSAVPGESGLECGFIDVTRIGGETPLPLPGRYFSFHSDRAEPPSAAQLLATSDRYLQGWQVGTSVAIQFHPELDATGINELLDIEGPKLARYGVDVDAIRAAADEPGSSDPGERLLNAWFATDPA